MAEDLTAVSQHQCDIAFSDLAIGDPVYKIYGFLPTDTMHAFRIHTIGNAVQLIFDCLTLSKSTTWINWHKPFINSTVKWQESFFQRHISVMVFLPCSASLLLNGWGKCQGFLSTFCQPHVRSTCKRYNLYIKDAWELEEVQ